LAYPADSGITPSDEAVGWTAAGPDRPHDENVNGKLGVMPPTLGPAEENDSKVNETLLEFAKGTLAYLNLMDATAPSVAL
jgi:hypothetical protein